MTRRLSGDESDVGTVVSLHGDRGYEVEFVTLEGEILMSKNHLRAHGFVLVTVDPELAEGGKGAAFDLVRWRLERSLWPMFKNTNCRRKMVVGSRLAFYVGGLRQHAGMIVATPAICREAACVLCRSFTPATTPHRPRRPPKSPA